MSMGKREVAALVLGACAVGLGLAGIWLAFRALPAWAVAGTVGASIVGAALLALSIIRDWWAEWDCARRRADIEARAYAERQRRRATGLAGWPPCVR